MSKAKIIRGSVDTSQKISERISSDDIVLHSCSMRRCEGLKTNIAPVHVGHSLGISRGGENLTGGETNEVFVHQPFQCAQTAVGRASVDAAVRADLWSLARPTDSVPPEGRPFRSTDRYRRCGACHRLDCPQGSPFSGYCSSSSM